MKLGVELLISEITGSDLDYPVHTKNMLIFITSYPSFEYHGIYFPNTGSNQIKSNQRNLLATQNNTL